MRKIHLPVLLLLVHMLYFCKPQQKSELASAADSLILLTLEMQQRISSSEIQRLSEFQDEIILDLGKLNDTLTSGTNPLPAEEGSSDLLRKYRLLNEDLAECLRACSYFHEEAFLLENTLTEIKNQAELKGVDHSKLWALLETEERIYSDLSFRIDSSLVNISYHAETFYSLKPGIDSLLAQASGRTQE
jgi:hypothetical protein